MTVSTTSAGPSGYSTPGYAMPMHCTSARTSSGASRDRDLRACQMWKPLELQAITKTHEIFGIMEKKMEATV